MELSDEAARRRAVVQAVRLVADTPLAPDEYERLLLRDYVKGRITLDTLEHLLAARTTPLPPYG